MLVGDKDAESVLGRDRGARGNEREEGEREEGGPSKGQRQTVGH